MQKVLIYWVLGASLAISGCSWLNDIPFVYKPDIQQGNVVEQKTVDQLRPGMSRTQAAYVLGTPMLRDVFHQDRWDYVYRLKEGRAETVSQRVTLWFEDNRLARIEGDLYPRPEDQQEPAPAERVIEVPDNKRRKDGLLSGALDVITFGMSGEKDRQE
jgi:outer membrane protein assembly factor BamE